jgi:DNA-binding HxlR family transcriptional regulator
MRDAMAECPFQATIELLSRRHALTIVWYLAKEPSARFTVLKNELGVNPVTLSERLSELERVGVLSRTPYNEIPPRVDYALTKTGRGLIPILDAMSVWAKTHGRNLVEAQA